MCRSIKTLFNFEPAATDKEIEAAALQFVRKTSGFRKPSKVNEVAFQKAVKEISKSTKRLLLSLETRSISKSRLDYKMKNGKHD